MWLHSDRCRWCGTSKGIGDTVVVGDYDTDGFLDLYVTNGDALGFDRPFWLDGSNQLFKNQGNGNSSIQIDLVGTNSNRDAVGAKVYITTPNGQRQVREQNGGIHNRGQNFDRLHFGLGNAERIQSIEVIWPDGTSQTFNNVAANRVIQITQNRNTIATLFNYEPEAPDLDLRGTTGDDRLQGSEFNNRIEGLAGNDTLKGLKGRDTLIGGNGDDYIGHASAAELDSFRVPTVRQHVSISIKTTRLLLKDLYPTKTTAFTHMCSIY